ncbi:MAG: hypothetical protein WC286_04680 [Bacilli bacterium]|jgi:hypothetical protein
MTNENQDNLYQTNQDTTGKDEVHNDSHLHPKESSDPSEVLNFNNPSFSFVPKGYHEWRQRGPYCVCTSCELEHAIYVGMDKLLIGIDEEGQPILKKKV